MRNNAPFPSSTKNERTKRIRWNNNNCDQPIRTTIAPQHSQRTIQVLRNSDRRRRTFKPIIYDFHEYQQDEPSASRSFGR